MHNKHLIVQLKAFFMLGSIHFSQEHKDFPKPKSDNVPSWFMQTERIVLLLSVKHKQCGDNLNYFNSMFHFCYCEINISI